MLWCGDSKGTTRSFTPQSTSIPMPYPALHLSQYSKFKTSLGTSPVKQYLNHQKGILSLLHNCVNFNNRRGLTQLSLNSELLKEPGFNNLSCMTFNSNTNNDLVIAGDSLFKVDLLKPNMTTSFNHTGKVSMIDNTLNYLTLGKSNGEIEIFDPVSNQTVKSFYGHNGLLSDIDVQGNYVASCGYSLRPRRNQASQSSYMIDPLVNIYDLRMMRSLPPIPFLAGASFVKFHPKLPNIMIIASSLGQLQFVDIYDQLNVYLYQADLSNVNASTPTTSSNTYLANLEVSGNGEFITFSDGFQNLHLWSFKNNNSKNFINFPSYLEQPDFSPPFQQNHINVDDVVPLSSIGMPYYKDLLLSNYASDLHFTKELLKLPNHLDPELLQNQYSQVLPYNTLKYGKRNLNKFYVPLQNNVLTKQKLFPKFISEKNGHDSFDNENSNIFEYKLLNKFEVPNCYSNLKIQYSKFGVEDFDFSFYNRTKYSGLENHLDNSYINSLLQLYKYSPVFQNFIIKHLLKEWLPNDLTTIIQNGNPQGSSILNELGYIFDMMNKSHGKNCKTSNFSNVLSQNQVAQMQELINKDDCKNLNAFEIRAIIGKFNKFLLSTCNNDLLNQFNTSLSEITNIGYEIEIKSNGCNINNVNYNSQLTVDLMSPPINKLSILISANSTSATKKNLNILNYLDYSMNQFKTIKCQQCNNSFPHLLEIRQSLVHLPPVILINVNFTGQEFNLIQNFPNWLVPEFYTYGMNNKVSFKLHSNDNLSNKYELLGYVCEINVGSEFLKGKHNLVSYIKIESKWYLFNDFLVMPIPESEVFDLSYHWKKPIIVMYQLANHADFGSFQQQSFAQLPDLNDSILYRDHFAGGIRDSIKREYELLTKDEAPNAGTLIAIDAEFVALNPEELEVHYGGVRNLIKPRNLSLARISVLRGDNGPKQGVPFIDDYIIHTCFIDDYLTSFSGIEPGDLDPSSSTKTLTTLQTSYRKLWLLLNLGCIFVGHGLQNDFRCINLHVPKNQIRDTADFFYLPELKRKLSLKFLAYILLKEKVQTGNHDSIEDANTALLLYKKYLELTAIGEFESTLHRIYMDGQQLRFRVPDS